MILKEIFHKYSFDLKISLRNVRKGIIEAFVVIIGSMIATALISGSLSLNDTITHHNIEKIKNNFGNVDIIISKKGGSFLLLFPFNRSFEKEKVKRFLDEMKIDYKMLSSFQIECVVNKKGGKKLYMSLIIGIKQDELNEFTGQKLNLSNGVIVGRSLAEKLGVKPGDELVINLPNGRKSFKISYVGSNGFLNYKGQTGRFTGSVFIDERTLRSILGYPQKCITDLIIDIKNDELREKVVKNLKHEFESLEIVDVISYMKKETYGKFLSYFVLLFAVFAIISGIFLLLNFFNALFYERRRTIAILKTMGYGRMDIFIILFVEGGIYIALSALGGTILGFLITKMVLNFVEKMRNISFSFLPELIEGMKFYVKPSTIFLAPAIGAFIPASILFILSLKASAIPVVKVMNENVYIIENNPKRRKYGLMLIPAFNMILFLIFKNSYFMFLFINSTLLILPFVVKENIFIHLLFPFSSVLFTFFASNIPFFKNTNFSEIGVHITRGGVYLVSSILMIMSCSQLIKKGLEKILSKSPSSVLSVRLALSYISKNKMKIGFTIIMVSIIIFGIVVTITVPYNVITFLDEKFKHGFLGYNFAIFINPLKTFMGMKEINWNEKLKYDDFERLDRVIVLPIKLSKNGGKESRTTMAAFIHIGKNAPNIILSNSMIPPEELWKQFESNERICVAGSFSSEYTLRVDDEITISIPSSFFQYTNPSLKIGKFRILGTYKPQSQMIPVEMILPEHSLPKNYRSGIIVYLGKLSEHADVETIESEIMKDSNFPLYITKEFGRMYEGLSLLANLGVGLLYFALITGFSGLMFTLIKSMISRKRTIGTLKAIGITSFDIFQTFTIEFSFVLLMGLIIGILSGIVESLDIINMVFSVFDNQHTIIPIRRLILLFLGISAVGMVMGMIPSAISSKIKASKVLSGFQ